eukprot:TRINITY_DN8767_c0_g1_i1.p1 TRINITY_DN8767_c0_g1~~TRINITY_DN8767_c0_g1_i1.p1  ORF type:complete len:534 (+),score=52.28 TRINITY_DN8767_c0_g1_i1:171-1772(+)
MKIIFLSILFLFLCINGKKYSVIKDMNGIYNLVDGISSKSLAYGDYDKELLSIGWNKLYLSTNIKSGYNDTELSYAAGYLEGSVDVESIWNNLLNNLVQYNNFTIPNKELDWLNQNYEWTKQQSLSNNDIYWRQVGLIISQMEGMLKGYNDHATKDKQIRMIDLLIINTAGDRCILDMIYLDECRDEKLFNIRQYHKHISESHCSSLIRLSDDRSDLFTSHTTWSSYQVMLRTYKISNLEFNNAVSSKISFSSYPGVLSSVDDFYLTDNGLSVIETTNGIMNKTLLQYVKPQSVLSWIRVIVSNQIFSSGFWWVNTFSKYNSGTYNNQWIIVDFKQFEPKSTKLKQGTLWILEQIPGYIESSDMTEFLDTNGYWPSFNRPYFQYIFNISGFPEYVKEYGNFYSYNECPRAKIFKRDHVKVNSLDSMKWIMRYNDYQNDPFSEGSPYNSISARADLSVGTNHTIPWLNKAAFGGIDTKVTSYKWFNENMRVDGQSGPTYNQQVFFQWKNCNSTLHYGQPDVFNFDFHKFIYETD